MIKTQAERVDEHFQHSKYFRKHYIIETPILYGEDARRFEARMQEHRRISSEERAEMDAIYKTIMSTANF